MAPRELIGVVIIYKTKIVLSLQTPPKTSSRVLKTLFFVFNFQSVQRGALANTSVREFVPQGDIGRTP